MEKYLQYIQNECMRDTYIKKLGDFFVWRKKEVIILCER